MKKIITFLFLFSLLFSMQGIAQKPGDTKPIASTSTIKGRKELRKEEKSKRKERKLLRKNEHKARLAQKDAHKNHYSVHRKKRNKEKNTTILSGVKIKN